MEMSTKNSHHLIQHKRCRVAVAEDLGEVGGRLSQVISAGFQDLVFVGVHLGGGTNLDDLDPFGLGT